MTPERQFFETRTRSTEGAITIGGLITAVLAIDNEEDARKFYAGYLDWQLDQLTVPKWTPRQVVHANIGWCYGEGMGKERWLMWAKLIGPDVHPFGITPGTDPEVIIQKGREFGEQLLRSSAAKPGGLA